jgi:uncharacterized repeat protein (TIGR01451 family)
VAKVDKKTLNPNPFWLRRLISRLALLCALTFCALQPVSAQELLVNRSFEAPVAPIFGNNFYTPAVYAASYGWTVTGTLANAVNIIKPNASYSGGPTTAQNGIQYFDVNSSAGTARQTFTTTVNGMIDFSAYFSMRDGATTGSGMLVNIRMTDVAQTIIYSSATSFTAADPLYSWKRVGLNNQPLVPGTYIFELVLPDPVNADNTSLVFKPGLTIAKSNIAYSDPVNGLSFPKLIPGAVAEYTLFVSNPGSHTITADTIQIVDATPVGLEFALGSFGPGPAAFTQGTPTSTLTYTFASLASTTDDLELSYDGGTTWLSSPSAAAIASGYDPLITHVRLRPKGTMAANSSFSFKIRYRIK